MCAIAGFSGNFEPNLLEAMASRMAHRGPDDAGVLYNATHRIGLAHRRLSIIDLSPLGHQPMWDATGTVAIVFNGEIYNHLELKVELEREGFRFNSQSDTEVILNLYRKYGGSCLPRLNGIFALAIWDSRLKKLLIARDGVGVKPLYYTVVQQGVLFASELKSLLIAPGLDRSLDHRAVFNHLTYLWSPSPDTILKHVKKLEPGIAMEVAEGQIVRKWRFYDLPYDNPIAVMNENEAVTAVRNKVREAVNRQMIADVPVGAFLSGGLDSSAIVAFAREQVQDGKLQCFTIGFKEPGTTGEGFTDDLPYAQRVASHLGVDLHTIYVGPEMADKLEHMIYHLDEPQADPAALNALFICQLARQHGIKVLLSGAGGDDIFTGYRRHYAVQQERFWRWLPASSRGLLSAVASRLQPSSPLTRRLAKAFQYAGLNGDARIASYFNWATPSMVMSLASPEWRHQVSQFVSANPLLAALGELPNQTSTLNRMLYLEGKFFLADHNLNYTDKMGMAVGVEVRVPLLDLELIDLATRMPDRYKQRGSVGKWVFKKAMEPFLPLDVIYRPKTGFGVPLRAWLQTRLKDLMTDLLSSESLRSRGLFSPAGVHTLIQQDRAGRIDGTYTIFALMCIELWCRRFIDSPVS